MPSFVDRIKSLVKRQSTKQKDQPKAEQPKTAAHYFTPERQVQPQTNQIQRPLKTYDRSAMQPTSSAATVTGTLTVALVNQTSSSQVYAYISEWNISDSEQYRKTKRYTAGIAIDNNNAVFLLQSDAKTAYYPASPSATGQALAANVSIPLGGPGNTVNATIPRLAGARIWFSVDKPLTFLVNPGPGLVEPSVFNQSDPNYNTNFSFCEFTFNSAQVFVNISYVDFVSNLPIALTLNDTAGSVQHVGGMKADGLATVATGLRAQTAKDGRRWSSLIVQSGGKDLRALSPNSGITNNPDWFATYWTEYVNNGEAFVSLFAQDAVLMYQQCGPAFRPRRSQSTPKPSGRR